MSHNIDDRAALAQDAAFERSREGDQPMSALDTYYTALNTLDAIRGRQDDREERVRVLGFLPVAEWESASIDERVRRAYYEFNPALGSTLLYALKERAAEEEMQKERTV